MKLSQQSPEKDECKYRKEARDNHLHRLIRSNVVERLAKATIYHNGHWPVHFRLNRPAIRQTDGWSIPCCRTCNASKHAFMFSIPSTLCRIPGILNYYFP
jgi:hypothetical protein